MRSEGQSREGTALRNEPSSKRQPPPTCHCEEAQPTWQSREGTSSSYKVPIKTYQPIASVAALSERLAGWQYSGHVFYGMRPPSLSFRGAKRRGNLKQALSNSPGLSCVPACTARLPRLLRSLAMTSQGGFPHPEGRNDKAESLLLALITSRTRQNRNQPREIATFPNQQTDPPIWDSSSLSAHLSFCGTSSLSASHARLLLSHPVLFQNKLIYEHDIAL